MIRAGLSRFTEQITEKLNYLRINGLYKTERVIYSRQGARITIDNKQEMLNFCADNYLGLSTHPVVVKKAVEMITSWGSGLSSVRFICGTQAIHKELEKTISTFHNMEDAMTYISCFDANVGLFETLFDKDDTILSDELNQASIINGIRLSNARKVIYKHRDVHDLEEKLIKYKPQSQNIIIATDGVFSMDGEIAPLKQICELAEKYETLTFIDESHATGIIGETGRGTEEFCNSSNRVDIINSTLGKAIGGAGGGYTTSNKEIIDFLRQKSIPYIFSNALPPPLIGSALASFELIQKDQTLLKALKENTTLFRSKIKDTKFMVLGDNHPICPVMMPDEKTAISFANELLKKGVFVIGLTYPIVPIGKPRIIVQITSSHATDDIEKLLQAFMDVGKQLGVI